jgi:uncharacterized protein
MAIRFEQTKPAATWQTVQGYGPGGWRISGKLLGKSVLLWPEQSLPWAKTELSQLEAEDFSALFSLAIPLELLLIGTGASMRLLPKALQTTLTSQGLAVEPMDSRAAARTYMVLLGEGRRIGALLLPL